MEPYIVIIDQTDTSSGKFYGAFAPDVPGCTATGKTLHDALEQIRTALWSLFHHLQKNGCEIPSPRSFEEHQDSFLVSGESLLTETSVVALVEIPPLYGQPPSQEQSFPLAA